jgi:hypothetical protein
MKLPWNMRIKVLERACHLLKAEHEGFHHGPNIGVIPNFSDTIWSTSRLDNPTMSIDVEEGDLHDEDGPIGDGTIRIFLTPTEGFTNTIGLGDYLNGLKSQEGLPEETMVEIRRTILIYNNMLKSLGNGNTLQIGKSSLITIPEGDGDSLGQGLVNWTGASVIYNFGWKPYINVDRKSSLL